MENDIETLAIALYVKVDDMLKKRPDLVPARPEGSIPPTVSDAGHARWQRAYWP